MGVLLLKYEVHLMTIKLGYAFRFASHEREGHVATLAHPDRQAIVARRPRELNQLTTSVLLLVDHHDALAL